MCKSFTVRPVRLSDGTQVFDVVGFDAACHKITLVCPNQRAAEHIRDTLNGECVDSFRIHTLQPQPA
jgi:hypothetical protein